MNNFFSECYHCENEITHICKFDNVPGHILEYSKQILSYENDHRVLKSVQLTKIYHSNADFMKAIDKLSWKASCGPDGWSSKLLKGLKSPISNWLEMIYSKSMDEGLFPKILKETFINGIFKGGEKSKPSNYRPIALTSHLSKTMERVLRQDIVDFLTNNTLWDKRQHGSRGGHSTLSQLLLHYNEIMEKLEKRVIVM